VEPGWRASLLITYVARESETDDQMIQYNLHASAAPGKASDGCIGQAESREEPSAHIRIIQSSSPFCSVCMPIYLIVVLYRLRGTGTQYVSMIN